MSAPEVTDKFCGSLEFGRVRSCRCNLANGDMVGHTGVLEAAVHACEVVDTCVGRMTAAG